MDKNAAVLVLGARGMVGSSLVRALAYQGHARILAPLKDELNLLNQQQTLDYFEKNMPQYVMDAAAKVGGIHANNTYRADFIFQNLEIQNNIFNASFKYDVKKLLFLGSTCIYPKNCPQPMKEEHLLTGPLEPTNEPYAVAKIAGLKMAENFRKQYGRCFFSVMPTNLYGENDNYDLENSHVIPGMIARMDRARLNNEKVFRVWGTGKPMREFLYVDDLADACMHLMQMNEKEIPDLMNVGYGEEISIFDLAHKVKNLVGFSGQIEFDSTKPDGTMKKLVDTTLIKSLGWKPKINLDEGLKKSVYFFNEKKKNA